MPNDIVMDRFCDMASLYAVGMLEPDEARDFEGHLAEGCASCRAELKAFREIAAAVPLDLPPQQTPPRVREELSRKIRSGGGGPRGSGGLLHLVRAGDGEWVETGYDGVRMKSLFFDAERKERTILLRMDPGCSVPAHVHGGAEQCMVLEGDTFCEDLVMTAGDFQCLPADTRHASVGTRNGCLLLVVGSDHTKFLS